MDGFDLSGSEHLGRCCACGKYDDTVRNVMMLSKKAPIEGTGWGCVVCNLPADGAVAVICDSCLETNREITHVCYGYMGEKRRVAISELSKDEFSHDEDMHAMEDERLRLCSPSAFVKNC